MTSMVTYLVYMHHVMIFQLLVVYTLMDSDSLTLNLEKIFVLLMVVLHVLHKCLNPP